MSRKLAGALTIVASLALVGTAYAADIKQYSYTGNPFTTAESPFTTSDFVSGFFTIDCDLVDQGFGPCGGLQTATDYSFAVLDFSFTAGPLTLEPTTPSVFFGLMMSTPGGGAVPLPLEWQILIDVPGGPVGPTAISTTGNLPDSSDFAEVDLATGFNRDSPGPWQVTSFDIPEPSSLCLFLLALFALLMLCSRRWIPDCLFLHTQSSLGLQPDPVSTIDQKSQ